MNIVMRIKKTKKTRSYHRSIAFFVLYIYFMFSLWFLSVNSLVLNMLVIGLILSYMWISRKKIVLKKEYLFIFVFLLGLIAFSGISNAGIGILDISTVIQIVIAMLLVCAFTKDQFEKYYSDAMYLIAVLSLVGFVFSLLFPSLANAFPYVTAENWIGNAREANVRNLFISVVNLNTNYPRNWGVFYEPGMFAFFLNVALYFTLIEQSEKNVRKIIVLTIAQITTMSTNGLFTLALIYCVYFIRRSRSMQRFSQKTNSSAKKDRRIKRTLMAFFIVALIAVVVFFIKNPSRWQFFISKIGELNGSSTVGSGFERLEAVRVAFEAVSRNPLFGLSCTGVSDLARGRITTFTPIQWFATYGLVYGMFCNCGFLLYGFDKKDKAIVNILKILTLFSMIVSQNLTANGIILAMVFYNIGKKLMRRKQNDLSYHTCL